MIDTALTLIKMFLGNHKETQQRKQNAVTVNCEIGWVQVGRPNEAVDHPALFLTIDSHEDFTIEQIELSGYELAEIRRVEGETVGGMGVLSPSILEPQESDWSAFLRVHVRSCPRIANRPAKLCYLARLVSSPEIEIKVTVTVKTATYPYPFTVTGVFGSAKLSTAKGFSPTSV